MFQLQETNKNIIKFWLKLYIGRIGLQPQNNKPQQTQTLEINDHTPIWQLDRFYNMKEGTYENTYQWW